MHTKPAPPLPAIWRQAIGLFNDYGLSTAFVPTQVDAVRL